MSARRGRPRELTQAQIRLVLQWHRRRMDFNKQAGSLRSFARSSGVAVHTLRNALKGNQSGLEKQTEEVRVAVTRWVSRYRLFLLNDLTGGALAIQLGVSRFTVYDCIRRSGLYKKRSIRSSVPKKPQAMERPAPLSRRATPEETARRASALRAWGRVHDGTSSAGPPPMTGLCKPLS